MAYELQKKPADARLAEAFGGQAAEFHELPYRQVREAMSRGGDGFASEGLLGASLHVDGKPIGLDAVFDAPGRFTSAIGDAAATALRLHGFGVGTADADEGDEAPKH